MFPGKSCYPLSPALSVQHEETNDALKISSRDQLKIICRSIGTPSEADKSFITDDSAIQYLELMVQKKHSSKLPILFEKANPLATDLLNEMLQFNPYFRISAKDALSHPLFDSVRQPHFEKPCPIQITQKIF